MIHWLVTIACLFFVTLEPASADIRFYDPTLVDQELMQENYTDIDRFAYLLVIQNCETPFQAGRDFFSSEFMNYFDFYAALFFLDLKRMKRGVPSLDKLNVNLEAFMHSYGYYLGLERCFPHSVKRRHHFTQTLIGLSKLGDVAGLIGGVSSLAAISSLALVVSKIKLVSKIFFNLSKKINAAMVGGLPLLLQRDSRGRYLEELSQDLLPVWERTIEDITSQDFTPSDDSIEYRIYKNAILEAKMFIDGVVLTFDGYPEIQNIWKIKQAEFNARIE